LSPISRRVIKRRIGDVIYSEAVSPEEYENGQFLMSLAWIMSVAEDGTQITDDFLNCFFNTHPTLFNYKIILNRVAIVQSKITHHLVERYKRIDVITNMKDLLDKHLNISSLSDLYQKHSQELFPLFYCLPLVKDQLNLAKEKFDLLNKVIEVMWQMKLLMVISEKGENLTGDDRVFVNELQFDPTYYNRGLGAILKPLHKTQFSGLLNLP
jgi:hypothetical protein